MITRKASEYVPHVYQGFQEYETIISIEDELLDTVEQATDDLASNQYITKATEDGIKEYETMLKITADPSIESLEFRRQRLINRTSLKPPFTFRFLKKKLNEILGAGNYNAYVDIANFTIYVESSAQNQSWFNELMITMVNIKPANMIFINKPLTSAGVGLSETISYSSVFHNYRLGYWKLGSQPFASYAEGGTIKMNNVSSLQSSLFADVAQFTAQDIASALINDNHSVTNLTKQVNGNEVVIEYSVPEAITDTITSIKLLSAAGQVLAQSIVYVPVAADIVLKHTIKIKEA